ncbi:hypothetical protein [Sphingobium bisphenolivorans]|uniref:hypothetical protein n=1 Tax=Sphingobium bisphenolivorans TaxID=1335760 RepID=UPI0003AA76D7|nr:hypothetical protein [Sphingobium bisphenolivorans]
MRPTEPLPLHHSWPLYALREHLAPVLLDDRLARNQEALAERGLGLWHCTLANDSLRWTSGVYDIFGLERGSDIPRERAVACYTPDSAQAMETLRAYAIRHRRGFTLDVDILPADGGRCAMRLIAAPIVEGNQVVALHGVKQLLSGGASLLPCSDVRLFDLP